MSIHYANEREKKKKMEAIMLVAVLKCAAFTFAHEKGTEQMNISLLLGCGQLTRTTN